MNKVRKTLVVVFSALFVLCMALFAVGCGDTNSSKTPDETKSAYSVSVDVNDPSLGKYTLTAANSGDAYVEGTAVTVTVEPNEDYDASLIVNGEEVALTDNSYTFAVQSDTDLQVNYSYKYVVYTSVTAGKGTVTLSEPKNGSVYEKGEEVTVTVEAAEHYELKSLRINNDYVNLTDGEVKFQITGKTYIFAEFVALHTVTVENEEEKGAVVLRANGKAVESGVVLAEGTEVELAVTPLNGNTVKAVYVAGAWTPLDEAGKATFTLQKDSVVEVVYNTYYTVTLPKEAKGGSVTLSEKAAALGYLEGTVLTLSVEPAEGYVVTSFKVTVGGEAVDGAKLNFKKYTFTVTADVTVEVEFEAKEDALTYNVNIALSNSGYGAAELSEDANDDGTYSYGTDLLLEVTPNDGYKVSYVTINGNRAEAQEDGKYAITVTEDIDIFVCFEKAARFTVRVEMYGLTGATATLQIDGNTLEADDGNEYIKTEVYEGQTASVAVTMGTLEDGMQLYYYLNGGARVLYVDGNIDIGKVTENVTVRLAAEAPTKPTYTYKTVVGNDEAELKPNYTGVVEDKNCTLENGKYTIKLNAPAELTGYVFDSWTVELDGKALTADATTGAYTFDYNDEGMALTLTATWNKTISVELPDSTTSNGTVSIVGNDPYIKDAELTIRVEPKDGFRIKTVSVTAKEQAIPVTVGLKSGEQEFKVKAVADLTVTVEYQAIFTYEYVAPAHASFTITATEGTFLEVNADNTVYTLDVDGTYTVNFTPDEGYQFTSVKVGEQSAVAGEKGAYTFTGALNSETEIKAVAAKTVVVTYSAQPNQQKYNEKVVVRLGDKNGEVITSGTKLAAGTKVYIHIEGFEGCVGTITGLKGIFGGGTILVQSTGVYNLSYVLPEDGLNITVTFELIAPTLSQNFPTAEQAKDGATEYPTQGEWKSTEGQDKDVLIVKENTMYVNGDPVTEFGYDLSDPSKFALTTENAAGEKKTYTLEWFGEAQGFILQLIETTPAPAPTPAGRRYAANDAAEPAESKVVYLVNPIYGASYFAPYEDGDSAKLVGENKTWTHEVDDKVKNEIVFSEVDGKEAHVSFNGTAASYVFAVETGHYLFVVGTTAYNMTIGDSFITVNGDQYLLPSTYAVTVTETPAETGCSYTLKNGDVAVTSGSAVTKDTKLTLTVTAADHYTAAVTVNGQPATAKEGSANVYEITVTAATTIAITYTLKQYSVTVTESGKPETVSEAWYELKNGTTAVTSGNKVDAKSQLTLTLKAPTTYTVAVAVTGGTETHEGNVYTITVTADTTITITYTMIQYTVTVTEVGHEGQDAWYTLMNGTTAVASGSKVDTGTELKLTLTLPQGYTATVKIGKNALTAGADGSYTIPAITADTTITITYTPPVVKSITAASGAHLQGALLLITVQTNFTLDELKTAVKLVGGTNECTPAAVEAVAETTDKFTLHFNGIVDWAVADTGYTLSLKVNDVAVELDLTAGATQSSVDEVGRSKTFTLSVTDGKLVLTVSNYVAPTPTTYTVEVKEEGHVEGCSYTLTYGDNQSVTSGGTVPTDATLTLTVTPATGYTATVEVVGGTKAQEGNVYTITNLTGNVTITITYAEEGQEPNRSVYGFHNAVLAGDSIVSLDFWFFTTGYTEAQINASKVTVNGVECPYIDGGDIQVVDGGALKVLRKANLNALDAVSNAKVCIVIDGDSYELKPDGDVSETRESNTKKFTISKDENGAIVLTVEILPEDPTKVPKANNDADAQNYPDKWSYYDPDGKTKGPDGKATAKFEDNTLKFSWADRSNQAWWAIQLYYVDSRLNVGDKYTVSFTVTAKSEISADKPLILRFFEGDAFADDITITAKDTPVTFNSKAATLNGNKQVIRMFVCGREAAENNRYADGSIEISNLVIHTYENGICTRCGQVCDHGGKTEGTCELCGATLVSGEDYTKDNVIQYTTWVEVPAELTKGNQVIIYGTQTSAMNLNEGGVLWECKEGYTGRLDDFGWKFPQVDNFTGTKAGITLKVYDAKGNLAAGDVWELFRDICKDSRWVIRIGCVSDYVLNVYIAVTANSGDHAGYTYVDVYDVHIAVPQTKYTFHLTGGVSGGLTKFAVTGYQTAAYTANSTESYTALPVWGATENFSLIKGGKVVLEADVVSFGDNDWNSIVARLNTPDAGQALFVRPDGLGYFATGLVGLQWVNAGQPATKVTIADVDYQCNYVIQNSITDKMKTSGKIKIEFSLSAEGVLTVTYTITADGEQAYTCTTTITGLTSPSYALGFAQDGGGSTNIKITTNYTQA